MHSCEGANCGYCPAEPPKAPDDSLTFACAMALDPSEVEVRFRGGWLALDKYKHLTLDVLRVSDFRRSRPKRSRAEEVTRKTIDLTICPTLEPAILSVGPAVIRAVMVAVVEGHASGCTPACRIETAQFIERHFLEPN